MFSKEWKLVVFGLAAIMSLTACPRKKKSDEPQTPYKGIWVNSVAYNELAKYTIADAQNPEFCQMLYSQKRRLGLVDSLNGLMLDAWVIHGNGEVFRYSAFQNSASHGYRNPQYREGHIVGSNCRRDNTPGAPGSFGGICGENSYLQLDRQMLSAVGSNAFGGGTYSRFYVQPRTVADLERISSVVVACSNQYGNGGNYGHGGPQFGPGQGGPQQPMNIPAPPPGQPGQGPEVPPYNPNNPSFK